MPTTATITTTDFTTFVANTRAKATQMNANFNIYRGHIVPVEVLTSTSSDNAYDVGSDEHRWRTIYTNNIDFETSTNTATLLLRGHTTNTTGSFEFLIEGETGCSIGNVASRYGMANATEGSYLSLTISQAAIVVDNTTAATFTAPYTSFKNNTGQEFLIAGVTVGVIYSGGIHRSYLSPMISTVSGAINFSTTDTVSWVAVTGSTVGVDFAKANVPVIISLEPTGLTTGMSGFGVLGTGGSAISYAGYKIAAGATDIMSDSKGCASTLTSYINLPIKDDYFYAGANTTGVTYYSLYIRANTTNTRAGIFGSVLRIQAL